MKQNALVAALLCLSLAAHAAGTLADRLAVVAARWDRPTPTSPSSVADRFKPYDQFQIMVTPGMIYIYGMSKTYDVGMFIVGIPEKALGEAGVGLKQGKVLGEGSLVDLQNGGAVIETKDFVAALRQAAR